MTLNLLEVIEFRDRLKSDLKVVEQFIEIMKARGVNAVTGEVNAGPKTGRPPPVQSEIPGIEREYGAVAELVREGINLSPDKYTINHIFEILQKLGKPLTKLQIATALTRFARRGHITVVKKGKGSRPTVYRKISAASAA